MEFSLVYMISEFIKQMVCCVVLFEIVLFKMRAE
jgi:hypothetical protein